MLVWPALWAPAEELTYLGYALPRLEAWIGRGPAAAVVSLVWAAQHLALPFIPDGRYLLSRMLTALTVTGSMTAGYLRAVEIPILQGRDFTPDEADRGQAVALVSDSLARRLWPGANPLGRRLRAAAGAGPSAAAYRRARRIGPGFRRRLQPRSHLSATLASSAAPGVCWKFPTL